MAIYGQGGSYDITMKLDSSLKTTTSQYMCVGMGPGSSTTDTRLVGLCGQTGTMADATHTADYCIGIIQSYQSASSEYGTVRLFGVSKATCAESIAAGMYVMPYFGASTTTMPGRIVSVDSAAANTASAIVASQIVTILGRALESGSTGTVISVFVNPQMYDRQLVGSINVT